MYTYIFFEILLNFAHFLQHYSYLGGKAAHEALINKIKAVIESYKWMFLLTALTVVATIVLAYILVCLIKASEPKLANQNQNILWVLDNGRENIVNVDHIYIPSDIMKNHF